MKRVVALFPAAERVTRQARTARATPENLIGTKSPGQTKPFRTIVRFAACRVALMYHESLVFSNVRWLVAGDSKSWLAETPMRVCGRGSTMARCWFPPPVCVHGIDDNIEPKEEKD